MIALPKAISHGSNGAGTGALTALTAMSAARAEPESSASAVASKTIFFMTIPIVTRSVRLRRPGDISDNRLHPICAANLRRGHLGGKRKRQATAAFLGVLALRAGCCCRVLHSDNIFKRTGKGPDRKRVFATVRQANRAIGRFELLQSAKQQGRSGAAALTDPDNGTADS